jgi:hypothetical protein
MFDAFNTSMVTHTQGDHLEVRMSRRPSLTSSLVYEESPLSIKLHSVDDRRLNVLETPEQLHFHEIRTEPLVVQLPFIRIRVFRGIR